MGTPDEKVTSWEEVEKAENTPQTGADGEAEITNSIDEPVFEVNLDAIRNVQAAPDGNSSCHQELR